MNNIPKKIWQTYKDDYNQLPQYISDHTESWKNKNPEYQYYYNSDQQAADFVLNVYGQEFYDIFVSLPLGVMRGDMWRYLVIYEYGGVYADLDTYCNDAIDSWTNKEANLIICPENDNHFCQWVFAAAPKHPAIKCVIDLMMERLRNPQYDLPNSVHFHTGPAVWTEGLFKYFEENRDNVDLVQDKQYNGINRDVYIYSGTDWRLLHWSAVNHIYGSQKWHERYVKWIDQV